MYYLDAKIKSKDLAKLIHSFSHIDTVNFFKWEFFFDIKRLSVNDNTILGNVLSLNLKSLINKY